MALETKWVVSQLDTAPSFDGLTDVVKTVHYRYQGQDEQYFAEVYGTLSVPSPDPADFVPYEEVTYEMVCSWLESGLDTESLKENLESQIADQINPKIISLPLPFQNP